MKDQVDKVRNSAESMAASPPNEKGITDTSQISQPGMVNLLACHGSAPGTIEDMEARGQQELVGQSSRLPTEGLNSRRDAWAAMGIVIGEVDEDDPLFTNVDLPAGWKIEPTDHSMHSKLMDEQGRVRAGIFYKAAFYDRRADIRPENRYQKVVHGDGCVKDDTVPYDEQENRVIVKDSSTGEVIFKSSWNKGYDGRYDGDDECKEWLAGNYPDWENPAAYWD